MINLLFRNFARFSGKFKLEHYSHQDFSTMCGLLKEKYQFHNQEIQTSGLIKLKDDVGRVIGVYTASEARKKTEGLGLDMVLVNKNSSPVICKVTDFRSKTINHFFQQIVSKSQKELEFKSKAVKSIKVSPSLNKNERAVKLKQIIELSLKFSKVRIVMNIKLSQKQESLGKLEEVKSELLNKCYVEEEITNRRFEEVDEEEQGSRRRTETFSFLIRARENDLTKKVVETKKQDPDLATRNFLKKYYVQDDGAMMDLKSAGIFEADEGIELPSAGQQSQQMEDSSFGLNDEIIREAEARILNQRLKVLLSLTL